MSEVERARTPTLEAQTRAQQGFLCSKDIPTGHVGDSHRRMALTDTDQALVAGSRREVAELARELGGNDNKSCYQLWRGKSPFVSRGIWFGILFCNDARHHE